MPDTDPTPAPTALDLIDIGPLVTGEGDVDAVERAIDHAGRTLGFFRITGHGIPLDRFERLDELSRMFFAQTDEQKAAVAMPLAGAAWRGWFPVGGELTSGRPDRKEGLYVGAEHGVDHPLARAGTPLHGANLFPDEPAELGPAILEWIEALVPVAHAVMRGIAGGLGIDRSWFERHLTADPTVLFRVFHYPPPPNDAPPDDWGVGEHTDYGLLTLLAQDGNGGLEVRVGDTWIDVPAESGVFVCNIGDMLDRFTEGRYRSTPHRVRNTSGRSRLSFPFFFDPSWDATVSPLPLDDSPPADDADRRWDGTSLRAWDGPYGDYLTTKVSKVFPALFSSVAAPPTQRGPAPGGASQHT